MAIFGGKSKKHHHSKPQEHQQPPPKYRQEHSPSAPIPFNSPPPQTSYFPPQSPPTSFPYGQPASPSSWVLTPQYQPCHVTISQTYLIPSTSSPPQMSSTDAGCPHLAKLKTAAITVTDLLQGDVPECIPAARMFNDAHYLPIRQQHENEHFNQNTSPEDLIWRLDALLNGDEEEPGMPAQEDERSIIPSGKGKSYEKSKGGPGCTITSAFTSTNYFSKVHFYANSRLPWDLPPMRLYISTFPLLCLAAQYAERVYTKPKAAEKATHIEADFRMGTKAMMIKSIPLDDMATIVFAIRGSQTFMDWAVNLKTTAVSPLNILDDPGNLCHAGFLSVARKMIIPVAARIRHLLSELHNGQQRATKNYSLLITGHSAGGAIAALLYSHMLSTTPETVSVLRDLTPKFKRIHCITFGAPPITLLPLMKPAGDKLNKSLFLSFVNEGDPVCRAEKNYMRSLMNLYSSPTLPAQPSAPAPIWHVPSGELSNAGRIVVLRSVIQPGAQPSRKGVDEGVIAQTITDQELRGVIWGDPACHRMRLYARRIEVLATNAVMGRG